MKSIFEIPLIGPLLRLVFSERGQMVLVNLFFLGAACWLFGGLFEMAKLAQAGKYLTLASLVLAGSWMLAVMLLLGIDRLRGKGQPGFANPSQKEILERFEQALMRGEAELSLQFNAGEVAFVSVHERVDIFTLSVTGGQGDPVDAEISDYLRSRSEQPFTLEKGKNLWRRRIIVGEQAQADK